MFCHIATQIVLKPHQGRTVALCVKILILGHEIRVKSVRALIYNNPYLHRFGGKLFDPDTGKSDR